MSRLEAEADARWSFVQKKANTPWIWLAMDAITRQIIAFHPRRVLPRLKALGASDRAIHQITVENPRRFFAGS